MTVPEVVLGLDTSTWWASAGVVSGGDVLAEETLESPGNHAVTVLPLIERVLEKAGKNVADLDAVAASAGPGSFSGLRVGLATVKGLAYASDCRLVTVSTLEALASAAGVIDGDVVVLLDARKGEIYWGHYRSKAGTLSLVGDERLVTIADATAQIPAGALVVGDAEVAYGEELRAGLPQDTRIKGFAECGPSGASVARLALRRLAAGMADRLTVEPRYIRPSEAELNAVNA